MMRIARSTALLPATVILLIGATATPSQTQPAMLPPEGGGWVRADSVGAYEGKDLFLLIDGGAELFFEYGFIRAVASEYFRGGDTGATTELYEMESATAAYGLFSSFTSGTGTVVPIGQEAVMGDGYCVFWKGPYVGMLTMASVDSSTNAILLDLATELEKSIHRTGPLPPLCTLLRNQGVEARTMVFVRGKLALGNHLPHAWASSFPPADGVVGTSGASRYLILEYVGPESADSALRLATSRWRPLELHSEQDPAGMWTIQERTGERVLVDRQGRYILAVAGEKDESASLASRLRAILAGS